MSWQKIDLVEKVHRCSGSQTIHAIALEKVVQLLSREICTYAGMVKKTGPRLRDPTFSRLSDAIFSKPLLRYSLLDFNI